MDRITASQAKQNFGSALVRAASAPVLIEKHGRVVAVLAPAHWLDRFHLLDERRIARQEQQRVEHSRLMAHQRLAIALLSNARDRRRLLAQARAEVKRWAEDGLCSRDYIERWNEWLALPAATLAQRMCSDADGWGNAMRQNSPFAHAAR